MRVLLAALIWLGLSCAARAGNPGPCPSFTAGWALSGPGPITGVLLDTTTSLMYMIWNNTFVTAYYPVPLSVMQVFSQSQNWVQTYQTYVLPRYEALLLQQTNNCPVLQESGGYIWVN